MELPYLPEKTHQECLDKIEAIAEDMKNNVYEGYRKRPKHRAATLSRLCRKLRKTLREAKDV
jgi:hypothetical protein